MWIKLHTQRRKRTDAQKSALGIAILLLIGLSCVFAGDGIESGSVSLSSYRTGTAVSAEIKLTNFFSGLVAGSTLNASPSLQFRFPSGFTATSGFTCTSSLSIPGSVLNVMTSLADSSNQLIFTAALYEGTIPEQSTVSLTCGPIRTSRTLVTSEDSKVEVEARFNPPSDSTINILYTISLPLAALQPSEIVGLTTSQQTRAGFGATSLAISIVGLTNALSTNDEMRFSLPQSWGLVEPISCILAPSLGSPIETVVTTKPTGIVSVQPTALVNPGLPFVLNCNSFTLPQEPEPTSSLSLMTYSLDKVMDSGVLSLNEIRPSADFIGEIESFSWFDPDETGKDTTFRAFFSPLPRGLLEGEALTITFPSQGAVVLSTVDCTLIQASYTGQNQTVGVQTSYASPLSFSVSILPGSKVSAYKSRVYLTCTGVVTPRIQASGKILALSTVRDSSSSFLVSPKSTYNMLSREKTILYTLDRTTTANAGGNLAATLDPLSNDWIAGDIIRLLVPTTWPEQVNAQCTITKAGSPVNVVTNFESYTLDSKVYTGIKITLSEGIPKNSIQVKVECRDVIGPSVLSPTFKLAPIVVTDATDQIIERTFATLPYITGITQSLGRTEASLRLSRSFPSSKGVTLFSVIEPFESPIDKDCWIRFTFPSHIKVDSDATCRVVHNGRTIDGQSSTQVNNGVISFKIKEGIITNEAVRTTVACGPLVLPRHSASVSVFSIETFSSTDQPLDRNLNIPFPVVTIGSLGNIKRSISLLDPRANATTSFTVVVNPLGTNFHYNDLLRIELPVGFRSLDTTVCSLHDGGELLTGTEFRIIELANPVASTEVSYTSMFLREYEGRRGISIGYWMNETATSRRIELKSHPLGGTSFSSDSVVVRDSYPESGVMGSADTWLAIIMRRVGQNSGAVVFQGGQVNDVVVKCTNFINPESPQPRYSSVLIQTGTPDLNDNWKIKETIDATKSGVLQEISRMDDPKNLPYVSQTLLLSRSSVLSANERKMLEGVYLDPLGPISERARVLWQGVAPDGQNLVATIGIFPSATSDPDGVRNYLMGFIQNQIVTVIRARFQIARVSVSYPSIHTYPGTCTNGFLDKGETDIDCGGDACEQCDAGKVCTLHADCKSFLCNMGKCLLLQ